jgi:dihydroorotase
MNLFFKNIRIIDPNNQIDKKCNLWLKDGIIKSISSDSIQLDSETEIIESDNLCATPGFFDMHAEIGEPGYEYKENFNSASAAALNGGFTEVLMMPVTEPVIDNSAVIDFIQNKTKSSPLKFHVSAALTQGLRGEHISDMLEMSDSGALMFSNGNKSVKSSEVLRNAFDYAASKDLLIGVHCEDAGLTKNATMNEGKLSYKLGLKGYPAYSEEIIVFRDTKMAEYSGNRKLHIQHISTGGSLEIIKRAKESKLRVSCEVAPQYLILDESKIETYHTNYKMNPPLRTKADIDGIIEGIKNGTVDAIVSDHKPASLHEKDVEYENAPDGIINFETAIALTLNYLHHNHKIDLNKIVELFATNPRNILGLPQIEISEGKEANLTLLAPDDEWVVDITKFKSKSTNSPFDKYKLKGKPFGVIVNNQFIKSEL